ncbi:MAG: hypothetical protein QOE22_419 [Candidatus Parcubacteria bacterium]|jgi:hypothetical protein|nr:hypothetical protein [Candidatus Parcubacteria bacterium]
MEAPNSPDGKDAVTPKAAKAIGEILGSTDANATGQDWVYPVPDTLTPPQDDPELRLALGFDGLSEPPVHLEEPIQGAEEVIDMEKWKLEHRKGKTP